MTDVSGFREFGAINNEVPEPFRRRNPVTAATPGQAAYEAYVMAAPDDMNFPVPDSLDAWERDAWEAAAQAGYEQRCQNDAAAQEPHGAPGLAEVVGALREALGDDRDAEPEKGEAPGKHAVRLAHYLSERIDELHGLIASAEPQPAPGSAAVLVKVRRALEDSPTASIARREALEIINATREGKP